ncbi:MAG: O-antigen ligase family protein [Ferruginibacter sp.]
MNDGSLNIIEQRVREVIRPFSKVSQKILNWFVFFLAFPAIELFGNSITFYIFIAIGIRVGSFWEGSFKGKGLLISFLILAISSTILAPYMPRHPGFIASMKILIQYAYWIFVALFFINQQKRIDFLQLSKWIFSGTLIASICFYFLNISFGNMLFGINLGNSRNAFVFNLLCTIPISFYYLVDTWGKKRAVWFMPVFLMIMLLTGGRSGAVLIIVQMIIVLTIIYPRLQKLARVMVPVFGLLYLLMQSDLSQIYMDALANQVESFNPRFASLLRGEGEGDLTYDKSWLIRKLMVDKGLEIFKEYPVSGVGPDNFDQYDSKLGTFNQYDRLSGQSVEYYNTRSAHNSYIQLLAEMGLPGFLVLIALLFTPLLFFFRNFFKNRIDIEFLPLVSLVGISIHFYAIAALTGAITWMVIGISWGILNNRKRSQ